MEELWVQFLAPFETTVVKAYCVYENDTVDTGTVFIFTFKESKNVPQELISVEQLMTNRKGANGGLAVVSCGGEK